MFATENANLREKISISHSVVKFLMTNRITCRRNFEKYDHLVPMYYIGWILIRNHENQDKTINYITCISKYEITHKDSKMDNARYHIIEHLKNTRFV